MVGGAESTWVSVNSGVFYTASCDDPDVSVLCCFADWGENQEVIFLADIIPQ